MTKYKVVIVTFVAFFVISGCGQDEEIIDVENEAVKESMTQKIVEERTQEEIEQYLDETLGSITENEDSLSDNGVNNADDEEMNQVDNPEQNDPIISAAKKCIESGGVYNSMSQKCFTDVSVDENSNDSSNEKVELDNKEAQDCIDNGGIYSEITGGCVSR